MKKRVKGNKKSAQDSIGKGSSAAKLGQPLYASGIPVESSIASPVRQETPCACDGGCPLCAEGGQSTGTKGEGQPLPDTLREFYEQRFRHDFSDVRLHTDAPAADSAAALDAQAYTEGSDIVFAKGKYSPGTKAGRKLLAHELTHTIQQETAGKRLQRQTAHRPAAAPNKKVKLTDLQENILYRDPNDNSNPVQVKRTGNFITIYFTGTMSSKSPVKLPRQAGYRVDEILFGGEVRYLSVNLDDTRTYPSGQSFSRSKSKFYIVTREGLIKEEIFTGFVELRGQKPGETTFEHKGGLRVNTTGKKITYSIKGGKLLLVFHRNRGNLQILDASDKKKILFDSRKRGFRKLLDLQMNPDGKGIIIAKNRRGTIYRFPVDLSTKPVKKFTYTRLKKREFRAHDRLVRRIAGFGVKIKEEGRQLSINVLNKLIEILSRLSRKVKRKLKRAKPVIRFTLGRYIGESQLSGDVTVGGQTKSALEDSTVIHELTHRLFGLVGLSTDKYRESDLDGSAGYLKSQVQTAMRQRRITKRLKALRALSTDVKLNAVWLAMFASLDRGTIPHFKRPANARIIDLADESSYGFNTPFDAGHPFDSVDEYIASFVTLVTFKPTEFTAAVKAAKSGNKPVKKYFKKTWEVLAAKKVFNLGRNLFN